MNRTFLTKIFELIRPTFQFMKSQGDILTKEIITDFVNDYEFDPMLRIELNETDKYELIEYSCKALGIDTAEYVAFRGLALTMKQGVEEVKHDKFLWHKYNKHLAFIKSEIYPNKVEIAESIDFETDQIIKSLPNPEKIDQLDFKALIIGHIQSGKTANFTHLISKLASLKYRFIIVLSGMTNALREQTQFRIDRELTGNNLTQSSLSFVKWETGENGYRTLTGISPVDTNYQGDFSYPQESFDHLFSDDDVTAIAVVKKLARETSRNQEFSSVLGKLLLWVTQSPKHSDIPIAIIDDESDQASIDNTDPMGDEDPSTINRAVRTLLSKFNKTAYFGYTATPFANVFISPLNQYNGMPDLYPKNLIYALPKPRGYFGTEEFFYGTDTSKYVVITPPIERSEINNPEIEPTKSLENAIRDFFFGFLEKKLNGDLSRSAMLVHTDHRNDNHEVLESKVTRALVNLANKIKQENIIAELNEFRAVSTVLLDAKDQDNEWCEISHDDIIAKMDDFLKELEVKVVNNRNENIDYNRDELQTMICIGGNILSRGLTIEGLMTSYYLRESNNYDTLLQMGRWFGYRMGYHHLMRIYMSRAIYEQFEYMSLVESDLRSEISRYVEEELEPLDFAPKVRAHMRMLPSSRMGSASRLRSYSQKIAQTFHLSRDLEHITKNENLVKNLLSDHAHKRAKVGENHAFKELDIEQLKRFITDYNYPTGLGIDVQGITDYINKQQREKQFSTFDLLVSSRKSPIMGSKVELYCSNSLVWNPNKRNPRAGTGLEYIDRKSINVGVLSSSHDIPNQDDEEFIRPLLILYSIDRINSNSFNEYDDSTGTLDLYKTLDGLNVNPKGFVLAFPNSRVESDRVDYFGQII